MIFDRNGNQVYCNLCGAPIVVNPLSSGDYYPTQVGIQLMGYCMNKSCHVMVPVLKFIKSPFGNNKKKKKCKGIALKFRLGFNETDNDGLSIATEDPVEWKDQFINIISEKHDISVERLKRAYATLE